MIKLSPTLIMSDTRITRGIVMIYEFKSRFLNTIGRKFYFTNRVVDHWNSLPIWVVTNNNTNVFKNDLA